MTCHLVWIVLLTPLMMYLVTRLSPISLRLVGAITMAAGLIGLLAIGVWVAAVWYPNAADFQRPYVCQKYAHSVACLVDLPVVQMVLCCGYLWLRGRRARRTALDDGKVGQEMPDFDGADRV